MGTGFNENACSLKDYPQMTQMKWASHR